MYNAPNDITLLAKRYSRIKYRLAISGLVYLIIILMSAQISGLSLLLKQKALIVTQNKLAYIAIYLLFLGFIYYVLDFPLNLYGGFILEHKFNLSNQRIKEWMIDQIKSIIISFIISLILVESLYFILDKFKDYWWVIVALFWIIFSVILTQLAPILIIPIFFKYKPVEDLNLKERIIKLANRAKIKILDVFEIDFSKKTNKANAALTGFGGTRRVILADTLQNKYSADEIEVILAHEFAHYKLKHIYKHLFINSACIIILLYLIFLLSEPVLDFLKLRSLSDISSFPILLMFMILFELIITPVNNFISRNFERNADLFSLKLTNLKEAFISTMEKLATQNLADRSPSALAKIFFFDHPPIDERIKMADKYKPEV